MRRDAPGFSAADREVLRRDRLAALKYRREVSILTRRAVEFCGGAGMFRETRRRDGAAMRRAARSFALQGGELCGCHEVGCVTCAWNGGCGDAACEPCQPLMAALGQPPRQVPSGGSTDATSDSGEAILDIHAHNLSTEMGDVKWFRGGSARATEAEERAARLAGMRYAADGTEQIRGSVIMTKYDKSAESSVHTGEVEGVEDSLTLNLITERIMEIYEESGSGYEGYFYPFVSVNPADLGAVNVGRGDVVKLDDRILVEMVRYFEDGWAGVGELRLHGHNTDLDPSGMALLIELCGLAAEHNKPVSMHWDFGLTDGASVDSYGHWVAGATLPSDNFDQLKELLDSTFVDSSGNAVTPTFIICHCGVGPGLGSGGVHYDIWAFPTMFADWKANIETLLQYSNVYFDLAGMQLGDPRGTPKAGVALLYDPKFLTTTQLGDFLLEKIALYPDRFLVGTDVDNGTDDDTSARYGVSTSSDSIPMYRYFLSGLDAATQSLVLWENAECLLMAGA